MTHELRCTPGQGDCPTDETCHRHTDHHWCGWCAGWYPVTHHSIAGTCHSEELLTMPSDAWHRVRSHATCACRFCRLAFSSSEADAVRILTANRAEFPVPDPTEARICDLSPDQALSAVSGPADALRTGDDESAADPRYAGARRGFDVT